MQESSSIIFEKSEIKFSIKRSKHRKRTITIAIDPQHGVILKAPLKTPLSRLQEVAQKRGDWIIKRLKINSEDEFAGANQEFFHGKGLYYLGEKYEVVVESLAIKKSQARCEIRDGKFQLTLPECKTQNEKNILFYQTIKAWFCEQAKVLLTARSEFHAKRMGLTYHKIHVRNQRRLWGSCDRKGNIRYNWKILMAPENLIDYLIIHELSHLRFMNHSTYFWNLVADFLPDYKRLRQELLKRSLFLSLSWYVT